MAQVYVVYTSNSRNQIDDEAIGVFSSTMKAIAYIKKHAKKYAKKQEAKLDKDDLFNLENIFQTQCRELNYEIKACDVNPKFSD